MVYFPEAVFVEILIITTVKILLLGIIKLECV